MNQLSFLDAQQQYVAQLLGQINQLLGIQAKLMADIKAANDKIKELEKSIRTKKENNNGN